MPTGDYYCIACPHQKCATCKTMKPLAAFSPVEGEQKVRHERYVCTQCKSAVRKKCPECKTEKEIASRSTRCNDCQFPSCAVCKYKRLPSEGAVRIEQKAMKLWYCAKCSKRTCVECNKEKVNNASSTRCLTCQFPTCAKCTYKRKESEGAVSLKEKVKSTGQADTVNIWYCEKCTLQSQQRKKPRKCEWCAHWKDRDQFNTNEERHVSDRCYACEFPTCSVCKKKYDKQRAIKTSVLQAGLEGGVWSCEACRRA